MSFMFYWLNCRHNYNYKIFISLTHHVCNDIFVSIEFKVGCCAVISGTPQLVSQGTPEFIDTKTRFVIGWFTYFREAFLVSIQIQKNTLPSLDLTSQLTKSQYMKQMTY